ncbi:MAG: hypothetical protein ACO3H6_00440 [Bacilli bacterium]
MKPINPKQIIQDDFETAIEEAVNHVRLSSILKPTLTNLNITESEIRQHLASLMKLEEDQQAVDQCRLAGKCLKPQGHYVIQLKRNAGGFLERQLQPCPMLDDQLKVSRFLIYDDFNEAWKDSKLLESLKQRDGQKPLYMYLMKVLQQQTNEGLALIGPHQSGKSFALGIFAYRYALNEIGTVGLLDFAKQMPRLLALKKLDESSFQRELERLQNLKVLILDGLGSALISEEMLTDILLPVYLNRQKPGLISMVTSTVPFLQLEGLFKGYKDKKMLMSEWLNLLTILTKPIQLPALLPL